MSKQIEELIPRRCRIERMVPAELAIREAILAVEKMPADERLTQAVILLGRAQEYVAAFVDVKAMTKPNQVVEALEVLKEMRPISDEERIQIAQKALPLAREMAEKLEHYDEFVEYKEALDWLFKNKCIRLWNHQMVNKCPAIIKRMT